MFNNLGDNSQSLFFSFIFKLKFFKKIASVKALNILIHVPSASMKNPRNFNGMVLLGVSFRCYGLLLSAP